MIGVMMITGILLNNPFKTEDKCKLVHLQMESNGFSFNCASPCDYFSTVV